VVLLWGATYKESKTRCLHIHSPSPPSTAQQLLLGQRLLFIQTTRRHSETSHSVGLLWKSDQPEARPRDLYLTNKPHSQKTDIHAPAVSESAVPAGQQPQTPALDRAATGIGNWVLQNSVNSPGAFLVQITFI